MSEPIMVAEVGNYNTEYASSLYAFRRALYRTEDGRFFFRETGGAAMAVDRSRDYVGRAEAIEFIAREATDPVTGYGYTREQAELMVDGIDAGKGYREMKD